MDDESLPMCLTRTKLRWRRLYLKRSPEPCSRALHRKIILGSIRGALEVLTHGVRRILHL